MGVHIGVCGSAGSGDDAFVAQHPQVAQRTARTPLAAAQNIAFPAVVDIVFGNPEAVQSPGDRGQPSHRLVVCGAGGDEEADRLFTVTADPSAQLMEGG